MSDIEFITVGQESINDFIRSWEAAFGRKLDFQVYNWIFDGKNIVYAALIDGEIAAGYCLYPFQAVWKGENKIALLCNNVFVNPKYQGRHLFVKLGKLALEDAGLRGYGDIAYGVPNGLALPGHKRVGWGIQPSITFLEKSVGEKGALIREWHNGELSQAQREDIEKCSRETAKEREFSIIKTAEFVKWRYESKPGVTYWFGFKYKKSVLVAYCVCKFYEPGKTLHFIDIDGFDSDSVNQLIVEADSVPEAFERLNIWASTAKRTEFQALGYANTSIENNFIMINPKGRIPVHLTGNVNISLADNDVY